MTNLLNAVLVAGLWIAPADPAKQSAVRLETVGTLQTADSPAADYHLIEVRHESRRLIITDLGDDNFRCALIDHGAGTTQSYDSFSNTLTIDVLTQDQMDVLAADAEIDLKVLASPMAFWEMMQKEMPTPADRVDVSPRVEENGSVVPATLTAEWDDTAELLPMVGHGDPARLIITASDDGDQVTLITMQNFMGFTGSTVAAYDGPVPPSDLRELEVPFALPEDVIVERQP